MYSRGDEVAGGLSSTSFLPPPFPQLTKTENVILVLVALFDPSSMAIKKVCVPPVTVNETFGSRNVLYGTKRKGKGGMPRVFRN